MRHITIYYIIMRYIIVRFFALSYIALYYIALLRPAHIPTVSGVYSIQRIPLPAESYPVGYCARWEPPHYRPILTPGLIRSAALPP